MKNMWQDLYTAAILELDRDLLPGRMEAAQAAIQQARQEILSSHGLAAMEEKQAIAQALQTLQLLQTLESRTSPTATSQGHLLAEG